MPMGSRRVRPICASLRKSFINFANNFEPNAAAAAAKVATKWRETCGSSMRHMLRWADLHEQGAFVTRETMECVARRTGQTDRPE
jgi:hypothetical protein